MGRNLLAVMFIYATLAVPLSARAMMGASVSAPLRHGIDAQCDPLDRGGFASTLRYAINEKDYPGEDSTGTFAHVLERGGTIVDVYLYSTETQTHGAIITRDCYLRGRLARMRTSYELRSGSLWTRTKYYSDDGSLMTETNQYRHQLAGDDTPVGPAPEDEPVYKVPAALPFYRAYIAKHRTH